MCSPWILGFRNCLVLVVLGNWPTTWLVSFLFLFNLFLLKPRDRSKSRQYLIFRPAIFRCRIAMTIVFFSVQVDGISQALTANDKSSSCNINNAELGRLLALIERLETAIQSLEKRVESMELKLNIQPPAVSAAKTSEAKQKASPAKAKAKDDDEVDLFASDSEVRVVTDSVFER